MGDAFVSKGLAVHESLSVATAHMESPSMVVHAHDPSAGEVETGTQAWVVRPNGSQTN